MRYKCKLLDNDIISYSGKYRYTEIVCTISFLFLDRNDIHSTSIVVIQDVYKYIRLAHIELVDKFVYSNWWRRFYNIQIKWRIENFFYCFVHTIYCLKCKWKLFLYVHDSSARFFFSFHIALLIVAINNNLYKR